MTTLPTFVDPVACAVAMLDNPNNVALFDAAWDASGCDATTFSHALVAAQRLRRNRTQELTSPPGVRHASPAPRGAHEPALIDGARQRSVATGGHAAPSPRARLGDFLLICVAVPVGVCAVACAVFVLIDAARQVMR